MLCGDTSDLKEKKKESIGFRIFSNCHVNGYILSRVRENSLGWIRGISEKFEFFWNVDRIIIEEISFSN